VENKAPHGRLDGLDNGSPGVERHPTAVASNLTAGWEVSSLRNHRSERGQGLMEYGMIIVIIAVLVMLLLVVLGPATGNLFSNTVVNI
jgi:pilus assembly protein Flp/PilA